MKNLTIVLNVVLVVAVGVLFYLQFSCNAPKGDVNAENFEGNTANLGVAYVNIDSVMINYNYAIELSDALTQKQNNMGSRLEKEAKEFEKQAQIFQDKLQRGIFLTQQRAEEAQQELMVKQQELQKLEYDYTNQLAVEQQSSNAQLFDSITTYINAYNTPEKFQVILGHTAGSAMLYGSTSLDITSHILEGLNERYPTK